MDDRQQILQRRARLLSSALVALAGCGRQGAEPAVPQGEPVVVPSATSPAPATAPPASATGKGAATLPPLAPPTASPEPPSYPGKAGELAAGYAQQIKLLDARLAKLEDEYRGTCRGDCAELLRTAAAELQRIDQEVYRVGNPLCPPSSPDNLAVVEWAHQHGEHLRRRVARLDAAMAELARRTGQEATWQAARVPAVVAHVCLSCAQW